MCGASGGASRAACPKKESTVCVVPSGVVGGGAWDVDSWGGADMVGYERPKVGGEPGAGRKEARDCPHMHCNRAISTGLLCISKIDSCNGTLLPGCT